MALVLPGDVLIAAYTFLSPTRVRTCSPVRPPARVFRGEINMRFERPPGHPTSRWMVLTLSTVAFTLMFNVWLMLGVLAPKIKETLGLSPAQVEWLIATSILSGALL